MTALSIPLQSSATPGNLWEKLLQTLRDEGKRYAAETLGQLQALDVREGALVLGVPNRFMRDWVDDHYVPLIVEVLERMGGEVTRIAYEVVAAPAPTAPVEVAPTVKSPVLARPGRLNARFTFSTFVVADSNQLPAAAARAVADKPGKHYNPLFIYGGSGLGKTHLLHAVGNAIHQADPTQRIVYLSSEEFTNEYVESVREGRMPDFRRRFRDGCDVLLVDDVQFLGRREETQKEFFYTFNALHEAGKAIVLTSDTVPAKIPGLEERLRSRFSMGLITDILEPSFETRLAILQKKAASEGMDLPERVAHFIARHVHQNVRELEGALVKMVAVHSLTGQAITEELAAQVLRDVLPARRDVDVESIQRESARYFKVQLEDLKQEKRTRPVAHARAVAMYLARTLTEGSFPELARRFQKDHTTVMAAVRKIEKARENDPELRQALDELTARLGVAR
ncbi:MAG TPA: chromosomal replication initiator protein DnaA [Myxococcaceae bacterium]|nr:chromosomal replication initiator protein DnaA [Myxococcaceae bacterium]